MVSRRHSPEGCDRPALRNTERAQGMPGAGRNPWPACSKKSRRQSPQVQPNIRHSPRDGFHAYTQSPWCAGLFGHHIRAKQSFVASATTRKRAAQDTSVGVSGPCDFTSAMPAVRQHASTPPAASRPSPPRLACRDDRAQRPSSMRRDACIIYYFWKKERQILRWPLLTRRLVLKYLAKLIFPRGRFSTSRGGALVQDRANAARRFARRATGRHSCDVSAATNVHAKTRYLSRYAHRVAVSNRRLVAADGGAIASRWKDDRVSAAQASFMLCIGGSDMTQAYHPIGKTNLRENVMEQSVTTDKPPISTSNTHCAEQTRAPNRNIRP